MTVESRITALWPTTELLLSGDTTLTVPYADARDQAITDAAEGLWLLYAPPDAVVPDVDAMSGLLQQQIAEMAVLSLIPYAKDWYLQDILKEGPEAGDVTLYDKLKALDGLADTLRASLAARTPLVARTIRDETDATTVGVLPPTAFTLAGSGWPMPGRRRW
jgi:hypothetical protein